MFGKPVFGTGAREPYVSPFLDENDVAGHKASKEAEAAWNARCTEAREALEASTTEPQWKIRREPEGWYEIYKRLVSSSDGKGSLPQYIPEPRLRYPASYYADKPAEAFVWHDTVKDYRNPIKDGSSLYSSPRYEPVKFNTLLEAEEYLRRLVEPQAEETSYNFPPLTRRDEGK